MRALLLLSSLLLVSCATDPTEVMLVVDGEYDTPTEIDSVDVTVTAPGGDTRTATMAFDVASPGWPRTLGIVRGGGNSGSYLVVVTGKLGGTPVISRKASFEFVSGRIRELRVDLLRVCENVTCTGMDRTCGEGGLCDRIAVDTDPWRGTPTSSFDAGASTTPIVVVP